MMFTYKFRLYPTKNQESKLEETLETCRRLFNDLLDDRMRDNVGCFEQNRALTRRRRQDKHLKQVHSQVLQDVTFRLDKAFRAFFKGIAGHPKFKRRGKYRSLTYPQLGGFRLDGNKLRLSKLGSIKIKLHREVAGLLKTCTIFRDFDQWYACLSAEVEPKGSQFNERPAVGVDLGVLSVAALSDGKLIPSAQFMKKSERATKELQRSLSRKKRGSRNREKARITFAKASRRMRNRRNDFAHKTSRFLADNYGLVVFEDLAITNMVKNHSLASAIMDACWGKIRRLTAYKAEVNGGRAILVDPRGTSQKCSACGTVQMVHLSERVFGCEKCGLILDRDVNAARNILARGLEQAHAEMEPLPVMRTGKFYRGSKKSVATGLG
ncbi:MAG TPA: transposase [Nitrososphaerales archaeon]|nr:transposase [Nitrososphaerales archaeon]